MLRLLIITLFILLGTDAYSQATLSYQKSAGTQSATISEVQQFYNYWIKSNKNLRKGKAKALNTQDSILTFEIGATQSNPDSSYITLLINNAIHAGEPDGVDATMLLVNDLMSGKINIPKHVRIIIVPYYNVNGLQNQNSTSRANQNGPDQYGFRANGQYLDLNRDMMKCDAIESNFMQELLLSNNVDVLVDNHVSNGADYQHIITLLTSQKDKYEPAARDYIHLKMEKGLYAQMKNRGYDLCPYVNHFSETPERGWQEFYESPRFLSGFASLFNIYAFVVETHMLKPYKQRVDATYAFLQEMLHYCETNYRSIKQTREQAASQQALAAQIKFNYQCDTSQHEMILFKGYTPGYKKSDVSGFARLYYDRNLPITRTIPFYNHFVASDSIKAPKAYIIPKEYLIKFQNQYVINQLIKQNELCKRDTTILVEFYRIENYNTSKSPYEGHYLHNHTTVSKHTASQTIHTGDLIIHTDKVPAGVSCHEMKKYYTQIFEPQAEDSYFNWNFFDAILQQKEGYSDYVFEDLAAEYLAKNPDLNNEFQRVRTQDPELMKSGGAQLNWVYLHSVYHEPGYKCYPILRWNY